MEKTIEAYIQEINSKNVAQRIWQFDYNYLLYNFSKEEIIKNVPKLLIKMRTFNVGDISMIEKLLDSAKKNTLGKLIKEDEENL